jgi:hypothetical protein
MLAPLFLGAATITNSGFESPNLSTTPSSACSYSYWISGYVYSPSGCGEGWTFDSGSGLTRVGSAFGNSAAPDGSRQAAFLQNRSDFWQTLTGLEVGAAYSIRFYALERSCCDRSFGQTISVSLGSTLLTFSGSTAVSPITSAWTLYTSDTFIATGTSATLKFTGNYTGRDATAFVDAVTITPEPATWGLLATGLVAGLLRLRRRAR